MTAVPAWVRNLTPSGPQGHELLSAERAKSQIPVEELSQFMFTKEGLERKRSVLKVLQQEKVFDKSQNYFAGRVERFETALARAKKLRQLSVQNGWDQESYRVASELVSEPGRYLKTIDDAH